MYKDLVIVTYSKDGKRYLFEAPGFSDIEKGTAVLCNTSDGVKRGAVVSSYTCDDRDDIFAFIAEAMGAKLPLERLAGVEMLKKFSYKDVCDTVEVTYD